ncbi:MAG TPA: type IV secretory system conjugative DNA transfer family protein [Acidimicrobiales bacterium]|jgi:type IV secretory pathway TraG/TraD family ATPase VirD4
MEHAQSDDAMSSFFDDGGLANTTMAAENGLYIGLGPLGPCWSGAQRSMLVLGPPRSGKTSSLVIPNVLGAPGAVISTSTKGDVMEATATARNRIGWSVLFDPSGEIECPPHVQRIGWSPLTAARSWDGALVTADAMVRASRMVGAGHAPSELHWTERAGALMAPLLHAAALEDLGLRTVLRWIDRHDGAAPLQILSAVGGDESPPVDLLTGIVSTDAREQSGIWSTASGVLSAYRTEAALASTSLPALDMTEFCGGPNTMYICAPGRRQLQLAPTVVAAMGDVRDTTYELHRGGRLRVPTLLALDEVANIAPLPDLPALVSEGAGQGLLVQACLQDLSQARVRWGGAADGFLSLFGTTVVLPGIADTRTLRDLSALAGQHEVTTTSMHHSIGTHGRLRPSTSTASRLEPSLPVDALARGTPGQAVVLSPDKRLTSVVLTPAHRTEPWRSLTAHPDHRRAWEAPALEDRAPLTGRGR